MVKLVKYNGCYHELVAKKFNQDKSFICKLGNNEPFLVDNSDIENLTGEAIEHLEGLIEDFRNG